MGLARAPLSLCSCVDPWQTCFNPPLLLPEVHNFALPVLPGHLLPLYPGILDSHSPSPTTNEHAQRRTLPHNLVQSAAVIDQQHAAVQLPRGIG